MVASFIPPLEEGDSEAGKEAGEEGGEGKDDENDKEERCGTFRSVADFAEVLPSIGIAASVALRPRLASRSKLFKLFGRLRCE